MIISSLSKPLNLVTIEGTLLSNKPVSHIRTMSEDISFLCFFINGTKFGDPLSSSPSKKKVTLKGSALFCLIQALQASTKVISWPLSSDDPRARMTGPLGNCSIAGSNGSLAHNSNGSIGWTS